MAEEEKKEEAKKEEKKDEKAKGKPSKKGADQKKDGPQENKLKVFLQSLSPRERNVLRCAGAIFVILLIDLIIIRPVNSHLQHINEMIREEETVIPKRLEILKYRKKILTQYKELGPLLTEPDLSGEEEIARFLREIEQVSTSVGLFISNINPVELDEKTESSYELSVNIAGSGTIDTVTDFMLTVERENPAVRVAGFNLRSGGKESEEVKYTFSIVKLGVREQPLSQDKP